MAATKKNQRCGHEQGKDLALLHNASLFTIVSTQHLLASLFQRLFDNSPDVSRESLFAKRILGTLFSATCLRQTRTRATCPRLLPKTFGVPLPLGAPTRGATPTSARTSTSLWASWSERPWAPPTSHLHSPASSTSVSGLLTRS